MLRIENKPPIGRPDLPELNSSGVPFGSRRVDMPRVVLPHVSEDDVVPLAEYRPDRRGKSKKMIGGGDSGSPLRGWDMGPPPPYPPTIGADGEVNSPERMTEEERLKFPVQQTVNNPRLRMLTLSTATRAEEERKANLDKTNSPGKRRRQPSNGKARESSTAAAATTRSVTGTRTTVGTPQQLSTEMSVSSSIGFMEGSMGSSAGGMSSFAAGGGAASRGGSSAATYRNWPIMDHMGHGDLGQDSDDALIPMKAFYKTKQVVKKVEKQRKAEEKKRLREEARKKRLGLTETRMDYAMRNAIDDLNPEMFIGKDSSYHLLHYKGQVGSNPAMRALRGGLYMHKLRTTPGRKTHAMMAGIS